MSKRNSRLCCFDLCKGKTCNKGDACSYCHLPKEDDKIDLNINDDNLIKVIIDTLIDLFNEHNAYQREWHCTLESKLCRFNICKTCKHDDECRYTHLPKTEDGDFDYDAIKSNDSSIKLMVETAIELFTKLNDYSKWQPSQSSQDQWSESNNEHGITPVLLQVLIQTLKGQGKGQRDDWGNTWGSSKGYNFNKGGESKGKGKGKGKYNNGDGNKGKGKGKGKGNYKGGNNSDNHQDND